VAISKQRADFQAMLTSPTVKRTPARENRLRANNVALMTSATICVQQAGGTRITLERLYEIASQEERAARQLHGKALATTLVELSELKTMMSLITDADGFSIINRRSSSPSLKAKPAPTPGDRPQVNLFMEEFLNAGEDDLKEYSLDPSTRQPTKKAFCGKETSLVTAALSTTSAVSPAWVSIYTNKRAALASPAKFGTKRQKDEGNHPFASKISPSAVGKQEFDRTMEEMERSREEEKATRKAKMAPLEQLVNEEEQESSAKEAARLA
jgi:hypothetical protein